MSKLLHIKQPPYSITDEQILVVKRRILFPQEASAWHGLKTDSFQDYFKTVEQNKEFHPRSAMENDTTYKQIIPYLVFRHEDRYFLMQRQNKASEQRLKNKYTLGIGGHIRQEDLQSTDVMGWARREFLEEVHYKDRYTVHPLGILNDDSSMVGKVHIGFVLLIEGNSASISVRSELKNGELYTLKECESFYDHMESWSQIVFDTLKTVATTV